MPKPTIDWSRVGAPSLSLVLLACTPDVCPALGQPLLDLPAPSDANIDCDALGWLAGIDELEPELELVLRRADELESPALLLPHPQGPIVLVGDELIAFDMQGAERWRSEFVSTIRPDRSEIAVGPDGRIHATDSFGANSYKVVIRSGDSGQQVGQFIVSDALYGNLSPIEVTNEGVWLTRETLDGFAVERYGHESGDLLETAELHAGALDNPTDLVISDAGVPVMLAGFGNFIARVNMDTADFGWRVEPPAGSFSSQDPIALMNDQVLVAWINETLRVYSYGLDSGELLWQHRIAASESSRHALAAAPGGPIAVVGNEIHAYGYRPFQPIVALLDAQGTLVAGQRFAVRGHASGVMFSDGDLFVAGIAELGDDVDVESVHWLVREAWR